MSNIYSTQQSMINNRGRVTFVTLNEVELRRNQGWKVVNNPKQDYYPEFDTSAGGRSAPETILEDLNPEDVLPGEDV